MNPESRAAAAPAGRVAPGEHSSFKSRGGFGRLGGAMRHSLRGLLAAWRHEAAFRQEVVVGLGLIGLAPWLGRDRWQTLLLIGAVLLVWLVELLNSAVEALADAVTLEPHPLIGRAKDLGSAAVMTALLLASAVWLTVLW